MERGFTLIEMLATIAIIAIVMSIAAPSVFKGLNESRLESDIRSAAVAHREFNRGVPYRSIGQSPIAAPLSTVPQMVVNLGISYSVGDAKSGGAISASFGMVKGSVEAIGSRPVGVSGSNLALSSDFMVDTTFIISYPYYDFYRAMGISDNVMDYSYPLAKARGFARKIYSTYNIGLVECRRNLSMCYLRQDMLVSYNDKDLSNTLKSQKTVNILGPNNNVVSSHIVIETWIGNNSKNIVRLVRNPANLSELYFFYNNAILAVPSTYLISDQIQVKKAAITQLFIDLAMLSIDGVAIDNPVFHEVYYE